MSLDTADPKAATRIHLRFADDRQLIPHPLLAPVLEHIEHSRRLKAGTPILLDRHWRPLSPWLAYFRHLAATAKPTTVRNYGYDALRFANFLDSRGTDVLHATPDDVLAYRDHRLHGSPRPVSAATWQRETVTIRGIYSFLQDTGQRDNPPWLTIAATTPLTSRWTTEPDIRPLTRPQWRAFRNIGLGGNLPNGELDTTWRGSNPLRSQAGAQLALTTGMRVGEFSSLITAELPRNSPDGATVLLEACAKYNKRRRVHIPPKTLRLIDLYRATERNQRVAASRGSLWARRRELYLVTEIDHYTRTVRGTLGGAASTWRFHQLPPHLRRIAVINTDAGLEALGLFLGRGGLPISLRAWHATFKDASRRVSQLAPEQMGGRRANVTPHDLRHTFAVVLLKALTARAIAHESGRRADILGPSSLSEHLVINPRLTVQRLLGHSNPTTTMVYLRYLEDTDTLIQDAFEQWDDQGMTFAELVLKERSTQ